MIKAIDAQQVIMQIDHAAKVQQQHPEVQQRFLHVQTQEERKLMQEKIKNAEETGRARIREDEQREKNRNEGGHSEKGKRDLHHDEEHSQMPHPHDGHINITI